jgi:transposase
LCLELTDPGFDHSVLCEFRARLIENGWEQKAFDRILACAQGAGYLKKREQQRTDATHVLGVIRERYRMEMVGETLRHALNSLAVVVPEWTRAHSQSEWLERYGSRVKNYRLPKSQAERDIYAEQIGADGLALLQAIFNEKTTAWLTEIPAVRILYKVWIQNTTWKTEEQLVWRQPDELPPASVAIYSPFDEEARFSAKRQTNWVGYKVHLTETCVEALPRIITKVQTTLALVADGAMTTPIHAALQAKHLLSTDHLVDTAHLDAELLVTSQEMYGINLVRPTRMDTGWQARQVEGSFAAENFVVDWERQQATCPEGKASQYWQPAKDTHGNDTIHIRFSKKDYGPYPLRT